MWRDRRVNLQYTINIEMRDKSSITSSYITKTLSSLKAKRPNAGRMTNIQTDMTLSTFSEMECSKTEGDISMRLDIILRWMNKKESYARFHWVTWPLEFAWVCHQFADRVFWRRIRQWLFICLICLNITRSTRDGLGVIGWGGGSGLSWRDFHVDKNCGCGKDWIDHYFGMIEILEVPGSLWG